MTRYIREDLLKKFEFQNYGHALEILHNAFPTEWSEVQDCLENLTISIEQDEAQKLPELLQKLLRLPEGKYIVPHPLVQAGLGAQGVDIGI